MIRSFRGEANGLFRLISRKKSLLAITRIAATKRDKYRCVQCDWSHDDWNRSDPRHLELHHMKQHAKGGENTEDNLITVCTVCHDDIHRKKK